MKSTTLMANCAIAGLVAAGLAASGNAAEQKKIEIEKCAGIAKAGKNDCATGKNSCSGTSKVNGDKNAWIELPKGTCEKIVGGTLIKEASVKK